MIPSKVSRSFSAQPYNPMRYLQSYIPTRSATKEEIHKDVEKQLNEPPALVHNLRHINPVRQSGPVPLFDGPYTMEDMLKASYQEYFKLNDICHASTDAEELMRRVPGITREEAEYIRTLGLTPDDEVEIAYWYKNIGYDIYYPLNLTYTLRQVVTNSKGEKVEVVWPAQSWDECGDLHVDTALQDYQFYTTRHWEAYSGDEWYKYVNNQDLGVPDTFFEYDKNTKHMLLIIGDQIDELTDEQRPWATPSNPNCRKELWRSQEKLQEMEELSDPNWKHMSPDDQLD